MNDLTNHSKISQSPACFMYTNAILKTACVDSVEESVACLLPCFVIYRDVGKEISKSVISADHPYYDWIKLYSGDDFAKAVETMCLITNNLGNAASSTTREKMLAAFVRSTQLEWLFWDGAYNLRDWSCD